MADTSTYPDTLDGALRDLVPAGTTPTGFEDFLQLVADAVSKVEAELGVNPAGDEDTVAQRIAALGSVGPAGPAQAGTMKQADNVGDAADPDSSMHAVADAGTPSSTYLQGEAQQTVDLANANKAVISDLVSDVAALHTTLNAVLDALKGTQLDDTKPMAADIV